MGFLGIGAMEALVIVVIALIIFGPGRLPEIMGEAGRMLRDFRRATQELTGDFEESINEVRGTYRELETEMRDTATGLRRDAQAMADDVNKTVSDATKLDGGSKTAARPRPRERVKLDQVEALDVQQDEDVSQYFPAAQDEPAEDETAPPPRKKSPVSAGLNGSSRDSDDLLSMSDGDDLLAVDDQDR